jgi:hypothetical protein
MVPLKNPVVFVRSITVCYDLPAECVGAAAGFMSESAHTVRTEGHALCWNLIVGMYCYRCYWVLRS